MGLGGGQRALLGRIGEGLEALGNTQKQLNYKADLPPLGNDPVCGDAWWGGVWWGGAWWGGAWWGGAWEGWCMVG